MDLRCQFDLLCSALAVDDGVLVLDFSKRKQPVVLVDGWLRCFHLVLELLHIFPIRHIPLEASLQRRIAMVAVQRRW